MKNIAILVPSLLTGGTEVMTFVTATALMRGGYNVSVVVYFDEIDHLMKKYFIDHGVNLSFLGFRRESLNNFKFSISIFRKIKDLNADIVWIQYMTPTLVPFLSSRFASDKVIASVHVAGSHYSKAGLGRIKFISKAICKKFVCVSKSVADSIFSREKIEAGNFPSVTVIPNAVDIDKSINAIPYDWRGHFNIEEKTKIIGFAGRLVKKKGVDVAIQSLLHLLEKGKDCCLVVVGDGQDRVFFEDLANRIGVSSNVYFSGTVAKDEMPSRIKGFDVAVMPSRSGLEGFGLNAVEAMACEVPLVASRVDALQEVVKDGVTGLLFRENDSHDLADKIISIISNSEKYRALTVSALQHARSEYGLRKFQNRVCNLIDGLGD